MRVRVLKQPNEDVNGLSLRSFKPGRVYDIAAHVADYLVVNGYARVEMRDRERDKPSDILVRKKRR